MIRRLAGSVVLLLGLALAGWVLYNLFVERLPETQGKSPLGAILLSAEMIYVGIQWLRGRRAQ